MVYHPMYNCRREYETLLYPSACSASCESEHDQRRYNNDYFGEKKHDIDMYEWHIPAVVPFVFTVEINQKAHIGLKYLRKNFNENVIVNVKYDILNFALDETNTFISLDKCDKYRFLY